MLTSTHFVHYTCTCLLSTCNCTCIHALTCSTVLQLGKVLNNLSSILPEHIDEERRQRLEEEAREEERRKKEEEKKKKKKKKKKRNGRNSLH